MNIGDLSNEIADEMGLQRPVDLISQLESFSRKMLSTIHAVGRDLRNTKAFPQLKRIYTFNTVNGQSTYPLPVDFFCKSLDAEWDKSNKWKLLGPLSDASFNEKTNGYVEVENRTSYRIFGPDDTNQSGSGQFSIYPTPGTTSLELSFEYTSKNFILPQTWLTGTVFAAGAYCFSAGNIYKTTAGGTAGATAPTGTGASINDGGVVWAYQNILYEKALAATDRLPFEDEVVIAGVKARIFNTSGLDGSIYAAEYERYKQKALSRWQGNMVIDSSGPEELGPYLNIPDGNWSV